MRGEVNEGEVDKGERKMRGGGKWVLNGVEENT